MIIRRNPSQQFHRQLMSRALSGEQFLFRQKMPKTQYTNKLLSMMPSNSQNKF